MISLKHSSYTRQHAGTLCTYVVYGNRYSAAQNLRKRLIAYCVPALILILLSVVPLIHLLGQSNSAAYLVLIALFYAVCVRVILKQRLRITIDTEKGLLFHGTYHPSSAIRSLGISRIKPQSNSEGSTHISVVLGHGEERLTPYINKELAKDLLQNLQRDLQL